jgi:formylglycine-generating enzyme required for sulfatase activity
MELPELALRRRLRHGGIVSQHGTVAILVKEPTLPLMRWFALLVLAIPVILNAGEQYPLWDGHESVADYAKKVNLPPTKTLDLGNGVKMDLVLIPAGKFIMGTPDYERPIVGKLMAGISSGLILVISAIWLMRARRRHLRPQFSIAMMLLITFVAAIGIWGGVRWNQALSHLDVYDDEHPAHEVTLTTPFYMGRYVVTQQQYETVITSNPSTFVGKNNPVETVSWDWSETYCKKLGKLTHETVRFPTEAEWEFACRAGTTTKYSTGDSAEDLKRVAWYGGNPRLGTHPVGEKDANAFGLYDMHGNVIQWCADWYAPYSADVVIEPKGPKEGTDRVARGSCWYWGPGECRSAVRGCGNPWNGVYNVGFRVVVPAFRTP